jgi:hypothetical protein
MLWLIDYCQSFIRIVQMNQAQPSFSFSRSISFSFRLSFRAARILNHNLTRATFGLTKEKCTQSYASFAQSGPRRITYSQMLPSCTHAVRRDAMVAMHHDVSLAHAHKQAGGQAGRRAGGQAYL